MTDFPDYDEPHGNATALAGTNLVGTGLAREAGGNLATHTALLGGTQAGALIAAAGRTVGQEVAALIASGSAAGPPGGTPLLHGAVQIYASGDQVIAPNGTFSTGLQAITKPGYLVRITCNNTGGAAIVPFVQCNIEWQVAASGTVDCSQEFWYLAAGAAVARRTTGRGPSKGDRVKLALKNGDAASSVTVNITIWETTQHMARDDWRGDAANASTTAGAIKEDTLANILAIDTFNVGAGVNALRNLPLYSGPASIWINQNVAAGSVVSIVPVGNFTLANLNPLVQLDWTALPFQLKQIYLPRCPCQLQSLNQGAGAVTFSVCMAALENAS